MWNCSVDKGEVIILRRKIGDEDGSSFLDSQHSVLLDGGVGWKHRFGEADCQGARKEVVLKTRR